MTIRALPLTLAAAAGALASLALAADPVPLDAILSAPHHSWLVSAPAGERVAWVENLRGARNVWVASGAGGAPAQITRFEEDDGQDVTQLRFSPDGRSLVFVRGGPAGLDGAAPDPLSRPGGAKIEIWTWKEGAPPGRYGPGGEPSFSPDGSSLAFVREGKVLFGRVSEPEKVTTVQLRGRPRRPVWSPDGSSIGFVSDRGDHAFIGVYSLATKLVTWMSPGFGTDRAPAWSPDGARIAFLRMPSKPVKPGPSWEAGGALEVWVADSRSGKGVRAFRSRDQSAGWAQDTEREPLLWAAGDRLIFPWEGDGWARFYAVTSSGGGKPEALTPQGCEARGGGCLARGRDPVLRRELRRRRSQPRVGGPRLRR